MNKVSILVISISNPILVGIYDNDKLIEKISLEGKASDALANIFNEILKNYEIVSIFYVNGPGSYMAIKVAYIFLKTLSITKNIEFKACDGFNFNNNSPIKALGKKYFIKDVDDNILIDFIKDNEIKEFQLPNNLNKNIFTKDILPNYNLPAVN